MITGVVGEQNTYLAHHFWKFTGSCGEVDWNQTRAGDRSYMNDVNSLNICRVLNLHFLYSRWHALTSFLLRPSSMAFRKMSLAALSPKCSLGLKNQRRCALIRCRHDASDAKVKALNTNGHCYDYVDGDDDDDEDETTGTKGSFCAVCLTRTEDVIIIAG